MKKIVLLSCVSKKLDCKAKAKDLYQKSPLFNKSLKYAETLNADEIYILSAKHHLLKLDTQIEPYDVTLNKMRKAEKTAWGEKVIEQLKEVTDLEKDTFIILAGKNYTLPIQSQLKHIELPLDGMQIGKRLKFLNEKIKDI